MVWYFIGVCKIKRTLHSHFGDTKFLSHVEKYISTLREISYLCVAIHVKSSIELRMSGCFVDFLNYKCQQHVFSSSYSSSSSSSSNTDRFANFLTVK